MIINSGNLSILNRAFNAAFRNGLAQPIPNEALLRNCVMTVPSTTAEEDYSWLGQTTGFREWIGERVYQALKQHDYSIKNKTWEDSFEINREKIEDDKYGVFSPVAEQLGNDAKRHPFELSFRLLDAGAETRCYDNQYFFDTDHPVGIPGQEQSVSNYHTGSGAPWYLIDASRVVKPIILQKRRDYAFQSKTAVTDENVFNINMFRWGADARLNVGFALWQLAFRSELPLTEENYDAACTAMQEFKADNGSTLGVMQTILMTGPSNSSKARRIVATEKSAAGADNIFNGTAVPVMNPWLP